MPETTTADVIRTALTLGYRWDQHGALSNTWKFHTERRTTTAPPPQTVTVWQAARICGLSVWAIYWHIRQGHLPALRQYSPLRLPLDAVHAFAAQHTEKKRHATR